MADYQTAPIGTFAPCFSGGGWTKVKNGWKWGNSGGTFPRPGADWDGRLLPTSDNEKARGRG